MHNEIKSYGFGDGNGNSIERGAQYTARDAAQRAQDEADARRVTVQYWEEEGTRDEDGVNVTLESVEPSDV